MRTFILRMLYILVLDATNLLDLFISLIFNLQAEFIFHVHFTAKKFTKEEKKSYRSLLKICFALYIDIWVIAARISEKRK